jgi:hypothetical protein
MDCAKIFYMHKISILVIEIQKASYTNRVALSVYILFLYL